MNYQYFLGSYCKIEVWEKSSQWVDSEACGRSKSQWPLFNSHWINVIITLRFCLETSLWRHTTVSFLRGLKMTGLSRSASWAHELWFMAALTPAYWLCFKCRPVPGNWYHGHQEPEFSYPGLRAKKGEETKLARWLSRAGPCYQNLISTSVAHLSRKLSFDPPVHFMACTHTYAK